jgi:hypothetical protein
MTFTSWPTVKIVKADDVGGANMVTKSGIGEGNVCKTGAM